MTTSDPAAQWQRLVQAYRQALDLVRSHPDDPDQLQALQEEIQALLADLPPPSQVTVNEAESLLPLARAASAAHAELLASLEQARSRLVTNAATATRTDRLLRGYGLTTAPPVPRYLDGRQ